MHLSRALTAWAVVAVLVALAGCAAAAGDAATATRAESALLRERFTAGRLARQSAWGPCVLVDSVALVPRSSCARVPKPGTRQFDEISALAVNVARRRTSGASARTLHTAALVDLLWREETRAGVDRAVASLERAAALAPGAAAVLNDLAVARLALAERDQQLRPLLQALDAIERARMLDDTLAPVLFNRALILERLYLVASARRAWARYLVVERDSAWRREATTHARRLAPSRDSALAALGPDELLARGDGPMPAGFHDLVRRAPQSARETGFAVLGEWGRAVGGGDTSRARLALDVAREIANALDAAGADRSFALAVRAIDAPGGGARRRALAGAHADFVDGYALFNRAAYDDAARAFERAERVLRTLGSPASRWVAVYRAAAALNRGDYAAGDAILRRATADATPAEPALLGKATWGLGLSQVRRGAYEAANSYYREAAPHFVRAREPENLGMISSLLTEGLEMAGQSAAGRVEALRALPLLSPYRRSNFLGSHLGLVAGYARTDGLHLAALAVMDEVIDATAALDKPQVMAWAHGERARILLEIGQADRARSELEEATRWADRIQAGLGRDEIRAEVMLARGQLLRPTDPRAARDELLRAVAALRASHSEITLPNALYQAALAARDAGDTATARRCLTQAVGEIEMRRAMFPTAEVRASFYETMERVFDAMVGLELDAGRPDAAFAYLERARAAAWGPSAATAGRTAATIGGLQRHLPSDALAVEYALLPDRLVVWTLTRRAWRHRSFPVPRDSIAALVTRFVEEAGGSEVTADGARVRLFDLLLRPIAGELAAVSKVAIVPDRELSQLPFVALWDSTTRKYVVQTHAVQTLPSAAFLGSAAAAAGRAGAAAAGGGALVIGDPAFDSVALPRVERLPGAAREAADVAQLYRRVHLVTGTAARRDTVLALLPGQSVFHFAGHAVANGEQPELSYLALAADQAADQVADGGMLRAREIGRLRLSNLRIVILSACSTLGARPSHVGAIAGLAYSFLRAGVPATVSSLWDVDDGTTTPLLVAFHQRLAEGVPAAEALRRAQVEALGSPKSVLHAPRAWAAFIYTGP